MSSKTLGLRLCGPEKGTYLSAGTSSAGVCQIATDQAACCLADSVWLMYPYGRDCSSLSCCRSHRLSLYPADVPSFPVPRPSLDPTLLMGLTPFLHLTSSCELDLKDLFFSTSPPALAVPSQRAPFLPLPPKALLCLLPPAVSK